MSGQFSFFAFVSHLGRLLLTHMNFIAFEAASLELGLNLTDAQIRAFDGFEAKLYKANTVMNLTRVPQEECWLRHFIDSLLFQDLIPHGAAVLDIGTGPGLPAWPLACARPDLQVTALDSTGKMIDFLVSCPLPNLRPVKARAEDLGVREAFDVVTGRALAPLAVQLELSAAPARIGGFVIPFRTLKDLDEIRTLSGGKLGLGAATLVERALPETDIIRVAPVYEKLGETPKRFPRSWAEIKRAPFSS